MSTANDLIQDAYTELLVHSPLKTLSSFAVDFARRKFQAMMQEWIDDDMDFGFSATEFVSDETSIPLGLHTAITTNLAVRLAPSVGKVANPTLVANAIVSLQSVKDQYQSKESADRIVSGTMPLGAGNSRGIKPPVFANADFVLSDVETNAGDPLI